MIPGMNQEPACGLRERKKRETLVALHEATVELVGARGLEAVTVRDIAEQVGVSPRTFFNYFESKEDAVLGISPMVSSEVLDAYVAKAAPAEKPVDEVVRLIWEMLVGSIISERTFQSRLELMQAHPALSHRVLMWLWELEPKLKSALEQRLSGLALVSGERRADYITVLLSAGMGIWGYILRKLFVPSDAAESKDRFTRLIQAFAEARSSGSLIPDFAEIQALQNEYLETVGEILGVG
jgi:AcrR family transcriptional regulator